jgi:GT2 family glycosyltransferase
VTIQTNLVGVATGAPATAPRASIVVVASRPGPLLDRCLEQLAAHETRVPFETIVVLNGAPNGANPECAAALILRSEVNLGLAGALNLARPDARGEFIVSLHDDSEVQQGWLDALVGTADREPEAGAVGSLVLDPSGQVTAAGWMLLRDGRTRAPWSGEAPAAASFTAVRPADYCPSCSLLVRSSTWDMLGGADERLFPLYYVDVDLCLAIRARGQGVLVDPRSVVVHAAGSSTDRDFAFFVAERNRLLMLEKWGDLIHCHEPGSGKTFDLADPPAQEWHSAPDLRQQAQIARHYAVSAAYGADLRARLAAREREIDESRRATEELLAAEATAREEAEGLRAQLNELRAELESLRPRSDRLRAIEQSRWWRVFSHL